LERFHRSLVCSNGRVRGQESAPYWHVDDSTIRNLPSERRGPKLLRISLRAGDEKALSVLSSGMLARGFLRCGDLGPEWRVRESHSGELVSLLLGPYTDVISIRLNPLPGPLAAEDALRNLLLRG
jgi:hypothetical protein